MEPLVFCFAFDVNFHLYKRLVIVAVVFLAISSQPTHGQEQKDKSNREAGQTKSPQTNPVEVPVTLKAPVTVINQPSAEEQAQQGREKAKGIWQRFVEDVIFAPTQWPNSGLLILAGIAAGLSFAAYRASWRQADAAEKTLVLATIPRLSIDGVRVVDLEVSKQPVFLVKILNSGPASSEKVKFSIRVESHVGGVKYTNELEVNVPANSSREFPIKWPSSLTKEMIDGFNKETPLMVRGYFCEQEGKQIDYCYKYYPWDGPRPEGVPQFIPCEFDTRRTVLITGYAAGSSSATGSLTGRIAPAGSVELTKIPKREE